MAEATVVSVDPLPILTTDCDSGLSVPPLDTAFFFQQLNDIGAIGDNRNDVVVDDLDFDFDFADFDTDDLDDLLNSTSFPEFDCQAAYDANFSQFVPNVDQFDSSFKETSSDSLHASGDDKFSGDRSSPGSGVLNSVSSELKLNKISGELNVPSPESNGSNRGSSENGGSDAKVMDCSSPESRVSENCGSNVSGDSNNCVVRSVSSSRNSNNSSTIVRVVNQKINLEEPSKNNVNSSCLKRKKDCEDLPNSTVESRINKCKKSSNCNSENKENVNNGGGNEMDVRRKVRLVRNRESAQLSRQRKKQYVDELEEKVKMMHSTIQDLNARVSYFMAENTTLRQQMGGGGAVPPPPMVPAPPGMYPHPSMVYPWMPYAPPYMMKQGSQVPLVPIPRLKPQHTAQPPKVNKKAESKKNEGPKIKKVAGVSFLGLLFFILLFGGLAPMINMRYGGVRETLTGGESYGFYEKHQGRVLMVNGSEAGEKYGGKRDFGSKSSHDCGGNVSEPLVASLYLPRNDKLVKIDGNLIIHSVLVSEKAMSSHSNGGGETGLAVPGDARHPPQLRTLGSSSTHRDSRYPKARDGRLQQWFREGFAGPMLSSGMCTEVFQFDVSSAATASGAILPAPTTKNISEVQNQNSTHASKGRNRRILRGLPIQLPDLSHNISEQHTRRKSEEGNLKGNNSSSPMVVSVLVDPREVGDADVDGVMGTKSISRIFVVVLIDSVKYATYSCMLPFMGSAPHLVTT
ncbi:hypothetical protein ACS0TY_031840 [Phlomoides rotata]